MHGRKANFVPENLQEAVIKSLKEKLSKITIGDPSLKKSEWDL